MNKQRKVIWGMGSRSLRILKEINARSWAADLVWGLKGFGAHL